MKHLAQECATVLMELVAAEDADMPECDDETITGAEYVRRVDAHTNRRVAAWAAARALCDRMEKT